jgi:hypothetical protein
MEKEFMKRAQLFRGLIYFLPGLTGLIFSVLEPIFELNDIISIVFAGCFVIIGILYLGGIDVEH